MGPPGCGKTNLLLLRASFLVRAGIPNIAIITYNRMLREFLASGAENYPFEAERIQTFRSWGVDLLKTHGVDVDTNGSFDEVMGRVRAGLSELRDKSGDEVKLDCILVDEAQDYSVNDIELMRAFAKEIFAVGDTNQRIYQAHGALEHLQSVCNVPPRLRFHYRSGMSICRMADGIMNLHAGGMQETCNYDESRYPSKVSRYGSLSLEEQAASAAKQLETQIIAYPEELVGVLTPLRNDARAVFELLSKTPIGAKVQLQRYEDGYEALDTDRPIIVTTMHSSKGLEYRAAHLLAVDNLPKLDNHQRVAYTAVTRAKAALSIYHDGAAPGYIESGLVAVEGAPAEAPTIAELFGGRIR